MRISAGLLATVNEAVDEGAKGSGFSGLESVGIMDAPLIVVDSRESPRSRDRSFQWNKRLALYRPCFHFAW